MDLANKTSDVQLCSDENLFLLKPLKLLFKTCWNDGEIFKHQLKDDSFGLTFQE